MWRKNINELIEIIENLSSDEYNISVENVQILIDATSNYFKKLLLENNYDASQIKAIRTKLRDAGRRSAPWKATSSIVPGRPQDGSDGNRINRWLLHSDHKFYATEVIATLVEIKYYLQLLSMKNAPLVDPRISTKFNWLLGHAIYPNNYKDPIQSIDIDFNDVIANPKLIQSGHLYPLDRGGVHHPSNTFLMYHRSNQLQGNLTVDELITLMKEIVAKHELLKK